MHNMLKVKDIPHLVRDPESKAIINLDSAGLDAYTKNRESRRKLNDELRNNINAVKELKEDMAEIKSMLAILLNNNKG